MKKDLGEPHGAGKPANGRRKRDAVWPFQYDDGE